MDWTAPARLLAMHLAWLEVRQGSSTSTSKIRISYTSITRGDVARVASVL